MSLVWSIFGDWSGWIGKKKKKKVLGKQAVIRNQIPDRIVILKDWFLWCMWTTRIQHEFNIHLKGQKTHLPNPGKVWNPHHCSDMVSVNKQVYCFYLVKKLEGLTHLLTGLQRNIFWKWQRKRLLKWKFKCGSLWPSK